jgi:predicted XRE-type DNA-binding protein
MAYPEEIQFSTLLAWMSANGVSQRELASRAHVDKMTVNRLVKGRLRHFDVDLIRAISTATGGAVGPDQFGAYMRELVKAAA